jgi:hypothetical protein
MANDILLIRRSSGPQWILKRLKQKRQLMGITESAEKTAAVLTAVADLLVSGLTPFTLDDAEDLRSGCATPDINLAALRNFVDLVVREPEKLREVQIPHFSSLSDFWGEQFRIGLEWNWYRLRVGTGAYSALVSPNAGFLLEPGEPMRHILEGTDNTIKLLYNMCKDDLGTPGALLTLS